MIAIPIAVTATPPIANNTLHHLLVETSVRRDLCEEYCFSILHALSCFIQFRFGAKRLMEGCARNQDRMALSNVTFRRQTASAVFNQSCRVSDVCHLTIFEGMQLIVFASAPAIAAFLICLAITMTR